MSFAPEIHLITYVRKYYVDTEIININDNEIKKLSNEIVENNNIFNYTSIEFKKKYTKLIENVFTSYKNISIIELIKKTCHTWNIYSISILYLQLICKANKYYDLDLDIFKNFLKNLFNNISPNYIVRNN